MNERNNLQGFKVSMFSFEIKHLYYVIYVSLVEEDQNPNFLQATDFLHN